MRLEPSDILGLTIGFALGGVGLIAYALLTEEPAPVEPIVAAVPAPLAPPLRPLPAPNTGPRVQADPMPKVIRPSPGKVPVQTPVPQTIATLPNVIHPDDRSQPGNISGTGFFIAEDGTLLTAAHVVDGCRTTQITSRHIARTAARVLATEPRADLALLRAPVRPPAVLAFSDKPTGGRDVLAFGYPARGDMLVPSETIGRARPGMGKALGWTNDPGLWLEAGGVRKGYSGGPVVTAEGEAIGLIKGIVLRAGPATESEPNPSGIAIGPDTKAIAAFLRREAPDLEPPWKQQAGDTDAARKAVVHVLCWR